MKSSISSTILLLLLLPLTASADGGFLPSYMMEIYESDQLAFLDFDSDAQRESLHILPKFYGDTQDFAWIVPTPALPDLAVSDDDLFVDCARLTTPIYRHRDEGWSCSDNGVDYADNAPAGRVEIVSSQLVGIYQTLIVSADDADALADSLTDWGFLHAGNREQVEPILDDYVLKSWYFVTMRIDSAAFAEFEMEGGYWYGGIQPIRLDFDAETPVYPLAISAISAPETTDVILYVVDGHRRTFTGARTEYANRIDAGELRAIRGDYPAVGRYLDEGDFLTELRRTFHPSEMDRDLIIERAASDAEFRRVYYSGVPVFGGLLLLTVAGWPLRKRFKRRS